MTNLPVETECPKERERELRAGVRAQIANAIRDELAGDELLMKETWEQCRTDAEFEIAQDELSAILAAVEVDQLAKKQPRDVQVGPFKFVAPEAALSRNRRIVYHIGGELTVERADIPDLIRGLIEAYRKGPLLG